MNQRLMERVSASGEPHLFHTDFAACNSYADGLARAAQVRCAARLIVGRRDAMTPPRAAKALAGALAQAGVPVDTVTLEAGHALDDRATRRHARRPVQLRFHRARSRRRSIDVCESSR